MPPFDHIVSLPEIMRAWKAFSAGKKNAPDVAEHSARLSENLHGLAADLASGAYRHGGYSHFRVNDTKPRDIHKASVRDRIVHHLLHQALYPYFDARFIHDSYSCRVGKGTHRALDRFDSFARKVSRNHTRTCWVLKCDIRKCFASIDHAILRNLLARHVSDTRTLGLISDVIGSFSMASGIGIPLGNLTSQLFVNVYLDELDHFVKHELRERFYLRYSDDFVILSHDREQPAVLVRPLQDFLQSRLRLSMHDSVCLRTVASGIDFLGWVHFPDHRVLRTATKRRALAACEGREEHDPVVVAYRGLLAHGNACGIEHQIQVQCKIDTA